MAFDAPIDPKAAVEAAQLSSTELARIRLETLRAHQRAENEALLRHLLSRPGC